MRQWYSSAQGAERDGRPNMLWMGAPQRVQNVTLSADGGQIRFADGVSASTMPFKLVDRIPTNLSYYNARSASYFASRPLTMRGEARDGAFVARTIWPQD